MKISRLCKSYKPQFSPLSLRRYAGPGQQRILMHTQYTYLACPASISGAAAFPANWLGFPSSSVENLWFEPLLFLSHATQRPAKPGGPVQGHIHAGSCHVPRDRPWIIDRKYVTWPVAVGGYPSTCTMQYQLAQFILSETLPSMQQSAGQGLQLCFPHSPYPLRGWG